MLAALTALLDLNLTRINVLETEKLTLINFSKNRAEAPIESQDLSALLVSNKISTIETERMIAILKEIDELKNKNIDLESKIIQFLNFQ